MIVGKNIVSIVSGHAPLDYVTLNEAKQQNNVGLSDSTFDAELTNYVKAAINMVSGWLGYPIQKSNSIYYFDSLEQGFYLRLPSHILSITSVQYIDDTETAQTLEHKSTLTNSLGLDLKITGDIDSLTEGDGKYKVSVVEGFELSSASGVNESAKFKEDLKIAILMLTSLYFTNRQPVAFGGNPTEIPLAFQKLIEPYIATLKIT